MSASCPRCHQVPLRSLRTREGTVGFCGDCHGHWLAKEAGASLMPLLARAVEQLASADRSGHCVTGRHRLTSGQEHCGLCPEPSLRCPECAVRMVPLALGGQTVDVCMGCPGLWLDAHELAALKPADPESWPRRDAGHVAASPQATRSPAIAAVDSALDSTVALLLEVLLTFLT